jgi:hypothetical protein
MDSDVAVAGKTTGLASDRIHGGMPCCRSCPVPRPESIVFCTCTVSLSHLPLPLHSSLTTTTASRTRSHAPNRSHAIVPPPFSRSSTPSHARVIQPDPSRSSPRRRLCPLLPPRGISLLPPRTARLPPATGISHPRFTTSARSRRRRTRSAGTGLGGMAYFGNLVSAVHDSRRSATVLPGQRGMK